MGNGSAYELYQYGKRKTKSLEHERGPLRSVLWIVLVLPFNFTLTQFVSSFNCGFESFLLSGN